MDEKGIKRIKPKKIVGLKKAASCSTKQEVILGSFSHKICPEQDGTSSPSLAFFPVQAAPWALFVLSYARHK